MDRRDFVKGSVAAAALLAVASKLPGAQTAAETPAAQSTVVAVRNGEPVAMFRKAIDALGGIGKFVKPGQKVVVKPNIGWDQPPEMGANTNPELVAEVVRQCVAAGAVSVMVFDHTCNQEDKCYQNSGIAEAVTKAGGKMATGAKESDYVEVECPSATIMKKAKIHTLVRDCDVLINIPVLKHHGGAKMTCAMKNYMGVVWDRKFMHQNNLNQSIADSVLFRKADLNIVDAYRVMKNGGPRGTGASKIELAKQLLVSTDIVAIDAISTKIIGFPQEGITYIALGEKLGLGCADIAKLDIKRLEA